MHSYYATSATQEVLDTLMIKYPPYQLAITSTPVKPTPLPTSPATQDIPLSDTPTTALVEIERWKTMEGKAIQRKKKNMEVEKK
jgi:hypothetical protein